MRCKNTITMIPFGNNPHDKQHRWGCAVARGDVPALITEPQLIGLNQEQPCSDREAVAQGLLRPHVRYGTPVLAIQQDAKAQTARSTEQN